jgi:hypothetical protein
MTVPPFILWPMDWACLSPMFKLYSWLFETPLLMSDISMFCTFQNSNRYDLELPSDFSPYNGDGEVEAFTLMPVTEALESIQANLTTCTYTHPIAIRLIIHALNGSRFSCIEEAVPSSLISRHNRPLTPLPLFSLT